MATAPVYNIEDGLERATVAALGDVVGLSACRIVASDVSSETTLPQIAVKASKDEELTLGAGVWRMRLAATLTTAADLGDDDGEATDDDGAAGFNTLWKVLTDTMHAQSFRTAINAEALCHVWGYEPQPVEYANGDRTFARTVVVLCHVSEAYDSA